MFPWCCFYHDERGVNRLRVPATGLERVHRPHRVAWTTNEQLAGEHVSVLLHDLARLGVIQVRPFQTHAEPVGEVIEDRTIHPGCALVGTRSMTLAQLRCTSLTVVSPRRDLH